jgi:hypothetical protein
MVERRSASPDRRREARAPLVASVRQRVGSEVQLSLAQDVATTGIRLKQVPGRTLRLCEQVSMAFELPDGGELVRVQGAVVFQRADDQMTGVRFEDLSPLDHARIVRYIHRSR